MKFRLALAWSRPADVRQGSSGDAAMRCHGTRKRGAERAVLYAALAVVLVFHVSSAVASPFVYVTNNASRTVSVLDTATNTVVATTPVDGAPIRVAVTPDGKRAYIAMRDLASEGTIAVLDTATNKVVATVAATDFFIAGVAITPDGKRAYVANSGNDHTVKVLETSTRSQPRSRYEIPSISLSLLMGNTPT